MKYICVKIQRRAPFRINTIWKQRTRNTSCSTLNGCEHIYRNVFLTYDMGRDVTIQLDDWGRAEYSINKTEFILQEDHEYK